jgi:hypothetical protein
MGDGILYKSPKKTKCKDKFSPVSQKNITLRILLTLLDGTNVRLNWNIESDLNVYWIKFKNFLSLY